MLFGLCSALIRPKPHRGGGQYTMCVENTRSDAPEDGGTSSFFNSGGGGTWSWISTRWRRGGDDVRSRFWRQLIGVIDTHLNDWGYFKGFLWLLLKVVMERDWLGCEDVGECLDKLVLCLTRHNNGNRLYRFTHNATCKHVTPNCPPPARGTYTLVSSLPFLLGRVFATMAVSTPSNVHLQ
jgi:hypothetical protein